MQTNKIENLVWSIFFIVGTMFFIMGIFICADIFNTGGKVKTTGTIERISTGNGNEVWISFYIDGEEKISRLNGYSSSFYEGKEVEIYYEEANPDRINMPSLDLIFLMFPGMGLLFAIIGGTGLLVKVIKKNKKKDLRESGEVVYGNYVETRLNFSYSVNNRHPYNIICKWNNPEDGKTYLYKSENIWFNPEPKIEDENITTFPIYVDSNNKKKYVVDIDKLTENIVDLS